MGICPSRVRTFVPAVSPTAKPGAVSREAFIFHNPGKVDDFYEMDKKSLGEGGFGTVHQGKCKNTQATRAIKVISKKAVNNLSKLEQEIALMKRMDHPYIIKLYESFRDDVNYYLVQELCLGGELFDRIIEMERFNEKDAAIVMKQILQGVNYMHQMSIAHRDLKPENFLLASKDPIEKTTLKIIDFGMSCYFTKGNDLRTKAGTPAYVAPEVLAGSYSNLCDVWSCGVIMYVLLCGYPPFYGEQGETLAAVKKGKYTYYDEDWREISQDAKTLIDHMIVLNVQERYTAEIAMNDLWIQQQAPHATGAAINTKMVENLKIFRDNHKFKKAALHIIAGQLEESKIKGLRETFMSMDDNNDGFLTQNELKAGLMNTEGVDSWNLERIMEGVDSDGSGKIDYTEFLAATLDKKEYIQENVCWAAFRVFDRNGDGKISKEELKQVLGDEDVGDVMHADVATLAKIMEEVDSNGDGEIDFEEFMQMMKGIHASED